MAPHDQRSKQVLTVLGAITIRRPYYVCSDCGKSRIPRDQELDIVGTKFSPGLRRMMAVVGSETSFEKGSEQLQVLAGIEVVPKAIQTHAEAIGTDIAASLREEAGRAKQLQFPEILHKPVPILYIEMDGTGIPVVKSETEGRSGRQPGQPARTRIGGRVRITDGAALFVGLDLYKDATQFDFHTPKRGAGVGAMPARRW